MPTSHAKVGVDDPRRGQLSQPPGDGQLGPFAPHRSCKGIEIEWIVEQVVRRQILLPELAAQEGPRGVLEIGQHPDDRVPRGYALASRERSEQDRHGLVTQPAAELQQRFALELVGLRKLPHELLAQR